MADIVVSVGSSPVINTMNGDEYQIYKILENIETQLSNKVDKVTGKGLSSNDYTAEEKTKLSELPTKTELDTDLSGKEDTANKVTTLDSNVTYTQYPSAKAVYDELVKKANATDLGLQFVDLGDVYETADFDKLDIVNNCYGCFEIGSEMWSLAIQNALVSGDFKQGNTVTGPLGRFITVYFIVSMGDTVTTSDGDSISTSYQTFYDGDKIYKRTILQLWEQNTSSSMSGNNYRYTYDPLTESQINNIGKKADKTTITTSTETTASITLADNTEARYGEITSLTVALPETISDSFVSSAVFKSGATATTVTVPSDVYCQGADCKNGVFTPKANKRYTMIFSYDGIMNCYIAAVPIQTVETQLADDFPAANDESVAEPTESVAEEPESEPNEVI